MFGFLVVFGFWDLLLTFWLLPPLRGFVSGFNSRSSSREVRIRVPFFFWSSLVGNPRPKNRVRTGT